MNKSREVRVTKYVLIFFSVGKYKDEVLCDVVRIRATHLLLGHLGNLIGRSRMIGLRIDIRLKMMELFSHLYKYHLNRFMKINWSWKRKVKLKIQNNHTRINENNRSLMRTNSARIEENRVLPERWENKERVSKKKVWKQ